MFEPLATPISNVFIGVFWVSVVLSIGGWVIRDARARGSERPIVWGVASVFTPVGLPYYLYLRYRNRSLETRSGEPDTLDRALAIWGSAGLATLLLSTWSSPASLDNQGLRPVVMLLVFLVVSGMVNLSLSSSSRAT